MRKITKLALAGSMLAVPMLSATAASADVSNNGTTNDQWGYCIANHLANFNGDHNGIGWLRAGNKGTVADSASNPPAVCTTTQGDYAPISNNP